jgi:hypothetical protein
LQIHPSKGLKAIFLAIEPICADFAANRASETRSRQRESTANVAWFERLWNDCAPRGGIDLQSWRELFWFRIGHEDGELAWERAILSRVDLSGDIVN